MTLVAAQAISNLIRDWNHVNGEAFKVSKKEWIADVQHACRSGKFNVARPHLPC